MKKWELAFTGSWPAGIVVLVAILAAGLCYWFYRQKRSQLSPRMFYLLLALRILAVVAVAMFIMKPVLRISRSKTELKQVVVLLDTSQSMGIRDAVEGKSRLEAGVGFLREPPYNMLQKISATHDVRLFSFGAFTSEAQAGGPFQADQRATALGDALKESVARAGQQGLAGVVLLTDGVYTTGEDPRKVARALGVPVFPVALGGRTAEKGKFVDVGIAGAPHNLELIVNNKAKLKFRLSNAGLEGFSEADRLLTLSLKRKEESLSAAPVQFPKSNGSRDVEIEFTPKELGIQNLVVSLPVLPGEVVDQNNRREFTVRVIDPKIRTLLLEGVARSEYKFLSRVLGSDPSVDLTSVIKVSKERLQQLGVDPGIDLSHGLPGKKEEFKKFDVIILGDMAREEFTDEQLAHLKEFVSDGGGLIALGGYHAYGPGGYADSPLADALPVKLGGPKDGQAEGAFVLKLTSLGKGHPVFEGCAKFFGEGANAATLDGANRVLGAKAGEVLAVHPTEKAGVEPLPVVVAGRFGAGNVLALLADTTWKWKFQIEGRGLDSPYYRFWRQSVRWAAGRKDQFPNAKERVSAWPNKIEYPQGENVFLQSRIRQKDGEPQEDAVVEAVVQYPAPLQKPAPKGGKPETAASATLKLEHQPLSLGEYRSSFVPPMPGIYRVAVKATDKEGEAGKAEFEFVVGQTAGEFDRVDVDETLLRALAGETGGEYHTLADASHIPDQLEHRQRRIMYHEEKNLWNAPGFFAVFLGCVALEWILRKRNALN